MAGADVGRARIDKLAVHLVGKEVEVVFLHQVAYAVHLLARVEIARGVVGVADEDSLRALVDEFLKLLHLRQAEPLVDSGGDGPDDGTGRDGERHIVGVGGLGDDDLVAGVEACEESKQHRLRASRGDDDVVGRHEDVILGIVVHEFLAIAAVALRRTVFEHLTVYIVNGVEGCLWCRQVGLTDVEPIHLYPALFGSVGQRSQFANRGGRHQRAAF